MERKKESFARMVGLKLVSSILSQPDSVPRKQFQSTAEVDTAVQRILTSQQRLSRKVGRLDEAVANTISRTVLVRSQYAVSRLDNAIKEKQRLEERFRDLHAGVDTHPEVVLRREELLLLQERVDDLEKHKLWLQTKAESLEISVKSSKQLIASLKETLHSIFRENIAISAKLERQETQQTEESRVVGFSKKGVSEHFRGLSDTSQASKQTLVAKKELFSVRSRIHHIAQSQSESFFRIREVQDFFEACWKSSAQHLLKSRQSPRLKIPRPLLAHHRAVYPRHTPASPQPTVLTVSSCFRTLSPEQRLEVVLCTPKSRGVLHNRVVSMTPTCMQTMASERTMVTAVSTPHCS